MGLIDLLKCTAVIPDPHRKQKVQQLLSQVSFHSTVKAIQTNLKAPEQTTSDFLCFMPWNWWSLVVKQVQMNCSPYKLRHLQDLPSL